MPRSRSVVSAMLAAALLAAGCGGDDTSPEPEHSQTPAMTEPATGDDHRPGTTTVPDSAQRTDQQGAGAVGEAASAVPRLGNRFAWCADIRAIWERQAQTQAQANAAEATYQTALGAYLSATDELDRAEAYQIAEAAFRRYEDLESDLQDATSDAARVLSPRFSATDETQSIALERAREAYRANADPSVQELFSMAASQDQPQPEPLAEEETAIEPLDLDQAFATLADRQSEVEELAVPIDLAHKAMLDGRSAIDAAEQPEDVAIGVRQLLDAAAELEELNQRLDAALNSASIAQSWHEFYEREALRADEITSEEYRENTDYIRAALNVLYASAARARDQAGQYWETTRAARTDVESKAQVFAVTDPDGMAAFWASLSESCRP